ncbi:MAG: ABC transporter ATP-binding protein [Acidimicrobiia bacterium]|nr:ABC transporter ATP-binding protein [Acidimicrobiia bacterium]MDH5292864.1 ABC transporter ATP-binding protein [Acidimicrobiia bacterium]
MSENQDRPPGGEPPAVELVEVTKSFGDFNAVDSLSLDIGENQFFAVIGPSGCGKTTTLRMVGGFEEPTAGTIRLHGEDVTGKKPYQRPVNTVFQSYALFPHLTIFENVAFGLRRQGVESADVARRVGEMLELVQLSQVAKRKPRQLSGGQQQRVALARALVNHPRVLLLDEPLGALDLKLRKEMQIELKRIQQEVGITFVHVTHDQEEAMTMADTIAVMNRGHIERMGEPVEIYDDPRTPFVASFLGASNLMEGDIDGDVVVLAGGDRVRATPGALPNHGRVAIGVRPEKILLQPADEQPLHPNGLKGTVTDTSFIGVSTHYLVRTESAGELAVVVQNLDTRRFAPGTSVLLSWEPGHTFVVGG